MNKVLFSWVQPKSSASMKNWNWREDHFFLILAALIVVVGIVSDIICDGFPGAAFILFMLAPLFWPNSQFPMLRPTYQVRDDGIRIKSLLSSKLCRWENIELYELYPSYKNPQWLTFSFKFGRGRKRDWHIFNFDRARGDESTLRAILAEKLAGKNLNRHAEIERTVAA